MLVSLVGLPGVGKSTVGRRLARHLGVDFVDCDAVVEQRLGEAIATWFEREGEASFRDIEEDVLQQEVGRLGAAGAVIATGGGAVVREANRRLLHEQTVCVWLDARPEILLERLSRSNRRPLLRVADPKARLLELAREREPLYRDTAHIVVPAVRSAGATFASLLQALDARAGGESPSTP